MPIYEYRCCDCGTTSEFLVLRGSEAPRCPSCSSENLEKLLSAHTTIGSGRSTPGEPAGGCCGSPGSCGTPGTCCSA